MSAPKIKLIVSDPDSLFYEEIKEGLQRALFIKAVAGPFDSQALTEAVEKEAPDVLILGPGWESEKLLVLLSGLRSKYPRLSMLAAFTEFKQPARDAIKAGAADIILIPIESSRLLLAIERVVKNARQQTKTQVKEGKIVTVFSTKGGVGKTVVAINLAVALSESKRANVAILDLDLQFGDVGVMLKLNPKYTIYDVLTSAGGVDANHLKSLLTPYSSKVSALLAPLQPELADLILPKVVTPTLSVLKKMADFVVVDTPPSFNDNVLSVLDQSDFVLLVGAMDLPSIKNIKLCIRTMKLLGYPEEKIRLVLNRVEKGVGLTVTEIESFLKTKISQTIPNDKTVLLSVNKGMPVLNEAPKSPAAISLAKLTDVFAVESEKALLSA